MVIFIKKELIIGISGIVISAGIGVYNLSPSYSVKDAHNQEMKEFRNIDTHLSVHKTITVVCETLTPDMIELYSCSFDC